MFQLHVSRVLQWHSQNMFHGGIGVMASIAQAVYFLRSGVFQWGQLGAQDF